MTLKELRIKLAEKEKTATWLAQQLGYSTSYLYQVIADNIKKEIDRIKNILEEI